MNGKKVGYFCCVESAGRHIGAMMVTDHCGIPLEFKYTEPIKPTRIQAILYGGSLERYVKLEVIRSKLVKSITSRPDIIFVDAGDPSLLGKFNGLAVAALQRTQMGSIGEPGHLQHPKDNELLIQDKEGGSPLRVILSLQDIDLIGSTEALVKELMIHMDVSEPLERVHTAIQALLKKGAS